ncbi:MAG: hypothetical protein KF819_31155 [Labilithrix sp.]|nr:hypothetical protein [Labilithrix sp.]
MVAALLMILAGALAFAAGFFVARKRLARRVEVAPEAAPIEPVAAIEPIEPIAPIEPIEPPADVFVRFDLVAPRGTRSLALSDHDEAWRAAMRDVGKQLDAADVAAVVFVHGSFVGTDPLSALPVLEATAGRSLAKALGKRTREIVDRWLGDLGNFGPSYVRLFEEAIGGSIPCTTFVWSSENHHVGRLEGALDLVRVIATHAELAASSRGKKRVLVVGHSHAGQIFALVTQLLARSLASEAIRDVARARSLDVGSLDVDLASLDASRVDFVTFGAPARYAWASVPGVRSLHVVHRRSPHDPSTPRLRLTGSDWVRRAGSARSDFPALASNERRLNASLDGALSRAVDHERPAHGQLVLVDYGEERLASLVASGLGHGMYTRLDGMLFHASLVASRLYEPAREAST